MPAPVTQEAPFYSDLKQMQLPIRNLRVGDTLEWQAKVSDEQTGGCRPVLGPGELHG